MAGVMITAGWAGPNTAPPPVQGPAPKFRLTDQSGRPFDAAALQGHPWIADFIFTSCPGQCAQMTRQMASLQSRLPDNVQFVSISVDPRRDTPEVLARYAQANGARTQQWHFLTGEPARIERLARDGFRLSYAEGTDPGEPIIHSVRFVLVDPHGMIRGLYDGTDPEQVEHLVRDVQSLRRKGR